MTTEKQSLSHKVANFPEYMTVGEIERYLALSKELQVSGQFDVRCDRCGESGSAKRMGLEDGVCIYCRSEQEVQAGHERLAAAVPKTGDELLAQALSLLEDIRRDSPAPYYKGLREQLTLVIDTLNLVRGVRKEQS